MTIVRVEKAFLFLVVLMWVILTLVPRSLVAQEINFDFEEADLRTVIQAVSEFTGRNFLVDPRVQGKVTVVAPTPLSEEEAYKIFQSVLEVNGFVTIDVDGATKILPAEMARIQETNVYDVDPRPNDGEIETRVLRLISINPERLVPILRPLIPPYGHLAADSQSSSLIITARVANVDRIANIISRLDRPTESGEVEVIPLTHASAKALSNLLSSVYPIADSGLTVMDDVRTNSIIIKADVITRNEVKTLIRDLDLPKQGSSDTNVIFLNNANAENLVEVLQNIVNQRSEQGQAVYANTQIMADPDTNALIVHASSADFNAIKQVIENLDVRRLQVYVEALIAEVSTDFAREFGIQFQTADGLREGSRGIFGGTGFDVGTNIQNVSVNPLGVGAGLSVGFIDGTVILPDGTEVLNLAGLARALDTQSNANILSTPNILTMDNQEAQIIVGQNVPFVTGGFNQTNAGTSIQNPFQTIERRDVGLTLRIRPQITEGSAIKLEIYQEVSSVAQRGEAQDIVTNTRSLQTTVVAENNRMVVLGGLIQDDVSQNRQKVPLLGDIPILGSLFTYRSRGIKKNNLLIFLRPRIIRSSREMDGPTRRKYQFLEGISEEQNLRELEDIPELIEDWDLIFPTRNEESEQGRSETNE